MHNEISLWTILLQFRKAENQTKSKKTNYVNDMQKKVGSFLRLKSIQPLVCTLHP